MDRLVQYPPEVLSKTVERASEMTSSLWGLQPSTNLSRSKTSKRGHKKTKPMTSSVTVQASSISTVQDLDQESTVSDASFDIVSNVSSQSPSASFVVTEPNDLPDVGLSSADTDEVFGIKRENCNLRGQLHSIQLLLNEVNREKSALQDSYDSLQKEVRSLQSNTREFELFSTKAAHEQNKLRDERTSLLLKLEEQERVLQQKSDELRSFADDRKMIEEENEELRMRIEKMKLDNDKRREREREEDAKLKLQSEGIDGLRTRESKMEEKLLSLQSQVKELTKLKETSEAQANLIQRDVSETQRKLVEVQSESLSLRRTIDELESENRFLKGKLQEMEENHNDEESEVDTRSLPSSSADFLKEKARSVVSKREAEVSRLKRELQDLRAYADHVIANERQINAKHLSSVQKELRDRNREVANLESRCKELEAKVSSISVSLNCQKEATESLQRQKIQAESQLDASLFKQKELQMAVDNQHVVNERLEKTVSDLTQQVVQKDSRIESLLRDADRLRERLARLEENSFHESSAELYRIKAEKDELKNVVEHLQQTLKFRETEIVTQGNDTKILVSRLEEENMKLRNELQSLSKSQGDAASAEVKDKKIKALESNVKLLLRKLNEANQARKELTERLSSIESGSTPAVQEDLELLRKELQDKDTVIKQKEEIILRLEEEKGLISKTLQSQKTQELGNVEAQLKQRIDEVSFLQEKIKELQIALDTEKSQSVQRCEMLAQDLEKERKLLKEARHSLFLEKRDHSKSTRDLSSFKDGLRDREARIEALQSELNILNEQLSLASNRELSLRQELDGKVHEISQLKESFQSQPPPNNSDSHTLAEELNHRNLLLVEKDQEIERIHLSFASFQRQHENEVYQLQHSLNMASQSAQYAESQVAQTRDQVYQLQNECCQLKVALQNVYDSNHKLRDELAKCNVFLKEDFDVNASVIRELLESNSYFAHHRCV